jgi:hypothetical protein
MDRNFLLVVFVIVFFFVVIKSYWVRYDAYHDPILKKLRQHLSPMTRLKPNVPIFAGHKSNTDKIEISLCVRDENGEYYDMNTLTQVALHEYAHVMIPQRGHGREFYEKMKYLREEAIQLNLFDPSIPVPCFYCGTEYCNK